MTGSRQYRLCVFLLGFYILGCSYGTLRLLQKIQVSHVSTPTIIAAASGHARPGAVLVSRRYRPARYAYSNPVHFTAEAHDLRTSLWTRSDFSPVAPKFSQNGKHHSFRPRDPPLA
ncbi:MAG TPA: hypothetical protein VMW43_03090 [Bacteroidota bacterium]|nr:hypothetical protein [Bacteroidota bacterium]